MDRIETYLEEIQQESIGMMAFTSASLLMSAYRLYKEYLTKAARACSGLDPKEKRLCMLKYKIDGKNRQLMALKSSLAKCRRTKNAEECITKIKQKAEKCAQELDYFKKRFEAEKAKPNVNK